MKAPTTMKSMIPEAEAIPSEQQMLDSCLTLSGAPSSGDQMAVRLQYLSNLLEDAGKLPDGPILVWREVDRSVKYFALAASIKVGRQQKNPDLGFSDDTLMSRAHFQIRQNGGSYVLSDLGSHNGTCVNDPGSKIKADRLLVDGDVVFAGNHIFVFLGRPH